MAKAATRQEPRQEPKTASVAEAKPKKKRGLLKIVIALLALAGGAGAAWYVTQQPAPQTAAAQERPPVFLTLEPFTVNLQPENGDQYLQVGLVLKVSEAATASAIKLHMPDIRNRILLLLSSKKASEISTVAGKRGLSDEILNEVKQPIGSPQAQGVVSVFFTAFVIQ